jgi:O-antigen/teichoic acid export membrane protein
MSLRNLSADFAFYGLLDLLQRSVSLVMVPLYTRFLTQQEYGELDMVLVLTSIFVVIVDLQLISGFSRFYLDYRKRGSGGEFVGTILLVRLLGGVTIAIVVFAAGMAGLVEWSFVPSFQQHRTAWSMVLLMVPLTLAYDVLLLQARMLRWKRPFATGALSSVVVSAALSVLFVVVLGWGIVGVMLGLVLGKVCGVTWLLVDCWSEISWRIDRAVLKPLFSYSLPLVPGWWMSFGSAYIGRFFIFGVHGADANALLAISMKVTSAIGLFAVSFRSAWLPLAMSYIGETDGERFYVRSMRLFMAGSLGSTLCLAAFLHLILAVLMPGGYAVVELYFPLFAVATLIAECESNLQLGNQIAKKTHWISLGALLYLVVNLAILAWLTARFGVIAAGLGLTVASLAKAMTTYVSGQFFHRIPYDLRAMTWFGVGCLALLLAGAGLARPEIPNWIPRNSMLVLGLTLPWLVLDYSERSTIAAAVFQRVSGRNAGSRE